MPFREFMTKIVAQNRKNEALSGLWLAPIAWRADTSLRTSMSRSALQSKLPHQGPNPTRPAGWLAAAIVVHLLVASMASAATTCSESMERTRVTRLTHSVAQAIRELVEHSEAQQSLPRVERDFGACELDLSAPTTRRVLIDAMLAEWLLNLPPPAIN